MRLRPEGLACGWRIVISPTIPQDSPPCYHSSMRHLVVLFIHSLATLVRLLGPGGVRSIVAESLLLKHQLLLLNRSRQRSPNLCAWDRILAGWMALLMPPTRLLRSAIVLKPSTLLAFHKALSKRRYRNLFSPNRLRKPGRVRKGGIGFELPTQGSVVAPNAPKNVDQPHWECGLGD